MHKKISDVFAFSLQVFSTFIILSVLIIMFLPPASPAFSGITGIGLLFMSLAFITATILFCLLLGLPIRLNQKLNSFWRKHWDLPIWGILLGSMLFSLSCLPTLRIGIVVTKGCHAMGGFLPYPFFAIPGWFLLVFSLLHIYPSLYEQKKSQKPFLSEVPNA